MARRSFLRFVRVALLMGAAYAATSKIVLEAAAFGYPTGLSFWPGAGLTLGMLLRTRRTSWPALLAGVFVAEFLVDLTIPVNATAALCWAVANTAEPLIGALLLTRRGHPVTLVDARQVLRFVTRGVVLGTCAGSLIGAGSAWLTGVEAFWPAWPRWWVGDAVGALAVAPALFVRRRPDLAHAGRAETISIVAALVTTTVFVLIPWPGGVWEQGLPYLLAPVLVVVAMRLGPQSSAIALAFTALSVNAVTALGVGPFAKYGTYGGLVVAQVCVAGAAFALLTVSAMNHDLVSLSRVQQMLREQALQDSLTGLANRRLLIDRLSLALRGLRRSNAMVGVLFVDLDGFKQLNDTWGHAAGDAALIEIADRLRDCVRPTDTVARVGGDEFALVLADLPGPESAHELQERIAHRLAEPFCWKGQILPLGASVGVALTTDPLHSVDDLLNHADSAMYDVKAARRT